GRVVSVRESGGTIYVNFGRRWSEDFTVTISKRNERSFAEHGVVPKALAGRRVSVRGVIEERGGPWIEAVAPGQIEIADLGRELKAVPSKRGWGGLGVVAVALALGACSSFVQTEHAIVLPDTGRQGSDNPADRGHQRILAAYGGAYNDARLTALLNKTVDRLVAASERPDLKYKVNGRSS